MKIDRQLQAEMLSQMREFHPESTWFFRDNDNHPEEEKIATLLYLEEHGLCVSGVSRDMSGLNPTKPSRITAAGLDFLEDDGGVSAILKTITVKLHADTIRDLLTKKVDEADLPADEKSALRKAVEGLPAAALTAGATDLIKMGLDHAPGGLAAIRMLFGLG